MCEAHIFQEPNAVDIWLKLYKLELKKTIVPQLSSVWRKNHKPATLLTTLSYHRPKPTKVSLGPFGAGPPREAPVRRRLRRAATIGVSAAASAPSLAEHAKVLLPCQGWTRHCHQRHCRWGYAAAFPAGNAATGPVARRYP